MRHSPSLVALTVALVACGGGSDKKTAKTTPEPTTPTTPVEPAKPAPPPPKKANPEIHAYTASENGFLVSSYAVVDNGEILLVDAQMIKPEAEAFIAKVKELGGTVKTIFITHAHPDHYMGLEWVVAAFPDAKVVAAAPTVEDIAKKGVTTLGFMKSKKYVGGALKDVLPAKVITPKPVDGDAITVGLAKVEVLTYPDAESRSAHPLWEPLTGSLIAGDLVYNNVHLWLKDAKPPGWIAALEDLKGRPEIKKVYPGHGEPAGPELIEANLTYLKAFAEAVKSTKRQKDLVAKVTKQFADYRLPAIVQMAAPSYHKKK